MKKIHPTQNNSTRRSMPGPAGGPGLHAGQGDETLFADRYLSNLTHVLRTPMIGILGSVDLLEHSRLDPAQQSWAEDIRHCGERLLNHIDDVLELSRLQYGAVKLEPVPTDPGEMIPVWVSPFRTLLQTKGMRLDLELDGSLPSDVRLDQGKLQRVISNLMFNILEEPTGRVIRLSARAIPSAAVPSRLLLSIACITGPVLADALTAGPGPVELQLQDRGISLGLIVCQHLIELMGGELRAVSQPGADLVYEVTLPLEAGLQAGSQPGKESAQLSLDQEFAASFNPVSILLVDDNELNQKLIGQMLTNYGFEVVTAANGLEALERMEHGAFDLVLMDMQMPRMDGYETTRLIRENQAWVNIPVIAITANSLSGDREKCLGCGCTSYLAKPFRSETLVREIKYLLHNEFIKDKQADLYSRQIIAKLLPEFMEMLEEMLEELQGAIKSKDDKAIRHISHSLKGTAGMYGFMKISELASAMEYAVAEQNYGRLVSLWRQITAVARESQTHLSGQGIV